MQPPRHIIGKMKSFTTAAVFALAICLEAAEPQIVRIWPKGIPNSWPVPTGPEKIEERGKDGVKDRAVSNRVSCILSGLMTSAVAFAQLQPPTFEVASVRPNLLDDRIVTIQVGPGGRFAARGYTLVLLIQRAMA